jgi:hypothetical protein
MSTLESGNNGNKGNIGSDKRLDIRGFTDSTELLLTTEDKKYSISTGLISVTADSAIASLMYTGVDSLVVTSNALQLLNVVGTPTSEGAVVVQSNAVENTGTFADFSVDFFNWNVGASRTANFTARKGSSGATFTGATQTIRGYFESPVFVVAQTEKFVIEQGNTLSIAIELPTGVTAADIVWMANVYEDDSARLRQLS